MKIHTPMTGDSILLKIITLVVTLLSCYVFYQLRTNTARDLTLTESTKVIQAATEIVKNLSEKGLPGIRTRMDELETRGRILEQNQKRHQSESDATGQQQQQTDAEILAARRARQK